MDDDDRVAQIVSNSTDETVDLSTMARRRRRGSAPSKITSLEKADQRFAITTFC